MKNLTGSHDCLELVARTRSLPVAVAEVSCGSGEGSALVEVRAPASRGGAEPTVGPRSGDRDGSVSAGAVHWRGPRQVGILVVSACWLLRAGVASFAANEMGWAVVRTVGSLGHALASLTTAPADVVLVDVALGNALAVARAVRLHSPRTRLVALGVEGDAAKLVDWLAVGVTAFSTRDGGAAEFLAALRVAGADVWPSAACSSPPQAAIPSAASRDRAPCALGEVGLTRRETQIVRLVDEGLTNKEIATRLYISAATVRNHVHNILHRLGVNTRSRAAALVRSSRQN